MNTVRFFGEDMRLIVLVVLKGTLEKLRTGDGIPGAVEKHRRHANAEIVVGR